MAHKQWFLYYFIFFVQQQVQSNPADAVESTTVNGAIASMNQLEEQIDAKKDNIVFNIRSFRQQYDDLVRNLTDQLDDSTNELTAKIGNVTLAVDTFSQAATEEGKDGSTCKSSFDASVAVINSRAQLGFAQVDKFFTLRKIPKQIGVLAKQIANYKKVMKACKVATPVGNSADTSLETSEPCGKTQVEVADNEVSNIIDNISESINNAEVTVQLLISTRNDEIEASLINLLDQFFTCLN